MAARLALLLTVLLFATDLLAAELSTPIRYGHDTDGVRVLLDLDLPQQTQEQRRISERLLLSVPLVWLPPGDRLSTPAPPASSSRAKTSSPSSRPKAFCPDFRSSRPVASRLRPPFF